MFYALVTNVAVLVALASVYGIFSGLRRKNENAFKFVTGIIFGVITVVGMACSVRMDNGIIYDGRSIILTLISLFGGVVPSIISGVMAGAYRIYLGGAGLWAGLATILSCSIIGLTFNRIWGRKITRINPGYFYLVGVLSHIAMLSCQLLLPWPRNLEIISQITFPVMVIFPAATFLTAVLFRNEEVRFQQQKEIIESREFYRTTLQSIGDAVIVTTPDARISLMNKSAEQLTEWTVTEALGKQVDEVFKIVNEQTNESVGDILSRVLKKGTVFNLANHTLLVSRSGKKIPIADSAAPIYGEDKKIKGMVIVFQDQTFERNAEQQILREKEQAQMYLDIAPVMIISLDTQGRICLANKRTVEVLGASSNELLGKNFVDCFVPEEQKPVISDLFNNCIQGARSDFFTHQNPVLDFQGQQRIILWHNRLLKDQNQKVIGVLSAGLDLTKEIKLNEQKNLLGVAVEQASSCILITDVNGNIQYVNSAFEQITGYSKEEVLGKNPRILKSGKHSAEFYKQLWDTIKSGKPWKGQFINKKKDGSEYYQQTSISSVFSQTGEIKYFVCILDDVTKEIELQRRLQRQGRLESIGQITSGIAHDFNNKLTAILACAELSMDMLKPEDPVYQNLTDLVKAAKDSAALIRKLLTFSRAQVQEQPKIIDLNEEIFAQLKLLKRLITENVELKWEPGNCLWKVELDPIQLDQILINLCSNARDAITGTGTIYISTENISISSEYCKEHPGTQPGDYVTLIVTDTGSGMTQEVLDHIFEPFFTTKEIGKGTGLGLSTVYGIVKQAGGFINVYSEPGKGATFKIYFPKAQTNSLNVDTGSKAQITRSSEVILMVEDDFQIIDLGKKVLSKNGYTVLVADKPSQAIQIAKEYANKIHLLITDLVMPEMDGITLSEKIKSIHPQIKVLYISGYPLNVLHNQSNIIKNITLLQKPFDPNSLKQKVREVLDLG